MGRTRSQAGKLAHRKGGAFERLIAEKFNEAGVTATRAWWQSLARGTKVPDVQVDGLWLELHHGATPPLEKLEQAEAYVNRLWGVRNAGAPVPVAVTRKTGAKGIQALLRASGWASLLGLPRPPRTIADIPLSMDLRDFLTVIRLRQDLARQVQSTLEAGPET